MQSGNLFVKFIRDNEIRQRKRNEGSHPCSLPREMSETSDGQKVIVNVI